MAYTKTINHLLIFAVIFSILQIGCEKEEEITGPGKSIPRPTNTLITVDKSTILTEGRDSSFWQIQLYQKDKPFRSAYTVNMLTDRHGYFLKDGRKERKISFETDANGEASIYFYGSREPGISTTLIWGEGFGPDTVSVSVIVGYPYYFLIDFQDPEEQTWMDTDTLKSGPHFSRPDSTQVRVTVLDVDKNPLEGILVNLNNGSPPIGGGLSGYFKSDTVHGQKSETQIVTDALGVVTDIYYSDVIPAVGDPLTIEIVAIADSAMFGRISASKFITITPP